MIYTIYSGQIFKYPEGESTATVPASCLTPEEKYKIHHLRVQRYISKSQCFKCDVSMVITL